jgi:hypothetical protein
MHGGNNYKLPRMNKDAKIADLTKFNVHFDASSLESALLQLDHRLGVESHLEELVNSQEQVEYED